MLVIFLLASRSTLGSDPYLHHFRSLWSALSCSAFPLRGQMCGSKHFAPTVETPWIKRRSARRLLSEPPGRPRGLRPDAAGGTPPACPGRMRRDSLRRPVLGTWGICSRRGNGLAALRLPAGTPSAERPEGDAPGAPPWVASAQVRLLRRKTPSGRARRGPSATARETPSSVRTDGGAELWRFYCSQRLRPTGDGPSSQGRARGTRHARRSEAPRAAPSVRRCGGSSWSRGARVPCALVGAGPDSRPPGNLTKTERDKMGKFPKK